MASSIYDNEARKTDRAKNLAAQQQTTASIIKKNLEASKASDGTVKKTVYEESQYVTPSSSGSTAPKTVTTPKTSAGSSLTGDSAVDALIAPEEVIAQADEEEEYEEEVYEDEVVYEEEPEEPAFTPYESRSSAVNIVTGTKPQAAARIANQKAELTALNEQESKKPEESQKDDDIYNNPGRQADRAENLAAWQEELDARETEKANAAESAVSEYIEADNTGSVFKEEELNELAQYLRDAQEGKLDERVYNDAVLMLEEGASRAHLRGNDALAAQYSAAAEKVDALRPTYNDYYDEARKKYAPDVQELKTLIDQDFAEAEAYIDGVIQEQNAALEDNWANYVLMYGSAGAKQLMNQYALPEQQVQKQAQDMRKQLELERMAVEADFMHTDSPQFMAKYYPQYHEAEFDAMMRGVPSPAENAAVSDIVKNLDDPRYGSPVLGKTIQILGDYAYQAHASLPVEVTKFAANLTDGKGLRPAQKSLIESETVFQAFNEGAKADLSESGQEWYDRFMSMAVSLSSRLYGGGAAQAGTSFLSKLTPQSLGLVTLATKAGAQNANEAFSRGATDAQAIAHGIAGFLGEYAGESISWGKLEDLVKSNPRALKEFVGGLLSSGATEGLEEGLSYVVSTLSDILVLGNKGDILPQILEKVGNDAGLAEKVYAGATIVLPALFDAMKEGAITGGIMGGGAQIAGVALSGNGSQFLSNVADDIKSVWNERSHGIVAPGFTIPDPPAAPITAPQTDSAVEALVNPQGVQESAAETAAGQAEDSAVNALVNPLGTVADSASVDSATPQVQETIPEQTAPQTQQTAVPQVQGSQSVSDPAVQALIDPESVVSETAQKAKVPRRTTLQRLRDEAYTERWKAAEQRKADEMYFGEKMHKLETRISRLRDKAYTERWIGAEQREAVIRIRETSKAADLRKNISRDVSALTTTLRHPTTKKFVPQSLQDTVSQFVNAVDIASSKDGQETKKAQAWKDRLSDLADYLEKVNKAEADKNGRYIELDYSDDAFVNQIKTFVSGIDGKATISQMSVKELQELSEITDRVVEMVRMADKVILNGKEMQISSAASRMIRDMQTGPKARNIAFRTMTDTGMIDPKRFFEQFGDVGQKLYESLLAGQRDYAAGMMQARAVFEQAAQKYHLNDWYNKRGDEFTFTTTSGQEITIGRGEALSIYASFKREEASGDAKNNHLTNGGFIYGDSKKRDSDAGAHRLSAEDKRKIVDNYLTSEQKQFADTIINYMSKELAAIGNATSLAQNGVKKFVETAYFPYRVSSDYIQSGSAKNQADQTALLKNKGFTKETVQNATAPVMLDDFLSVFDRHTNEMLQYAAMSIPQDAISKVFGYRSFEDGKGGQTALRNEMAKAYGDKAGQYLDDFIKQLSGSMTGGQSIGVADTLMRNVKVASVLANAQVIIQQPSAGLRALAMVDPKYFIGKPHTGSFDEAAMYSGTAFVKKVGGYDVGTTSGASGWLTDTTGMQNLAGKAGSFFTDTEYRNDILGKGAQLADNLTWGRIWEAVKRETADKTNLAGEALLEKAGERFDQVIDATQVYDSVLTKSGLMRSQNTFTKMATAYMSEPTKMLNMITGAASGKGNVSLGRAVGAVAASQIANILLKSLTRAMRDDDEWQTYGEKYEEALLANAFGVGEGLDKIPYIGEHLGFLASDLSPLSMIPWAQDVLSVFQGYDVERMDMSLIADFANVLNGLDDENKTSGEKLLDLSGAIANLFGVPATNVLRDMEGFYRTLKTAFTGGIDMMSDERLLYEAGFEPNKKGMQEELDAARAAMQSGMSREEALSLVAEMDELKTQFDDLDVLGVFDKNEFYTDFLNSKGLSTEAAQAFLNTYLSDSAMDNTMVSSEGQAYTFENDPDLYWANAAGFETIDDIARVLDELADVKSDMITQDKYLSDPAALMAAYVDKMNELGLDASQQDYILKRMNDMDAKSPSDKMTDDALKIYAQGAFGLTDQQYHDYFEAGGVSFNQDGIDLLLSGMNEGVFTKEELGTMTDAVKYATTAKGVDMDGDGRADTDSIRNEQLRMYIELGLDENQMRLMSDFNERDATIIDDMETAGRYGLSNEQYMNYFVDGENAMSLNSENQEAMLKAYQAGTFKDLDTMANQVNAFTGAKSVDADGDGEPDMYSKRDAAVQALIDEGADSAQIAAIYATQYGDSTDYTDAMQKAEKAGISPQDFVTAFEGKAASTALGNLDAFIESQKKEVGMDAGQFADMLDIVSNTQGVKDANGETINGSKKYNIYTALKESGLSESQIVWTMTQRKQSDGEPMYKNMEIDYAPAGATQITAGADGAGQGTTGASSGTAGAASTGTYGASKHDLTKGDIKRRNTAIPNYVKNMGVDEKNAAVLWDGLYTITGDGRNVKRMEYLKEAGFSEKAIAWIWNAPQSEGGFGYKSDYRKYYGASSGEAWDSGGSASSASSAQRQSAQGTQKKAQMQASTQSFMQRWGLTGNPFGTSSGGMNYSGYASLLGLTQQAAKRLYDTIPLLAPLGGRALVSHLRGMGLTDQAISRLWKMPIDQGGLGRTDDLNQYLAA